MQDRVKWSVNSCPRSTFNRYVFRGMLTSHSVYLTSDVQFMVYRVEFLAKHGLYSYIIAKNTDAGWSVLASWLHSHRQLVGACVEGYLRAPERYSYISIIAAVLREVHSFSYSRGFQARTFD